jgi:serine/threonine protein phosphatase PrpC
MADSLLSFDADQQISAIQRNIPQNDCWHIEEISPRQAAAFTLVVVADGDGSEAAGQFASLAVKIAFAEAQLWRDEPLPKLFRHLINQMNEVVYRQGAGDMVGFTLAAIRNNKLSVIQAGSQTRLYRVHGERAALLLTKDNDHALGKSATMPALPLIQYQLRKGDKLVFCSDGLYAADLVTPSEIAKIDRYDDLKGAARHLSALAMGRNVIDNVTVVIAAYGHKSRWSPKILAFDALGILLAILIVTVIAGLILKATFQPPRPPDLGVAVLAEGSAIEVEQLQIIYPGKDVHASPDSPIQIRFKRRESAQSNITQTIPNVDLILGDGARANLTSIDVQGFTEPNIGINDPTDLTEIRLYEGRALILSRDPRTFYVWLGKASGARAPRIVLRGAEAALGVDLEGQRANAYCLRGSCSLQLSQPEAGSDPFSKVSFPIDFPSVDGLVSIPVEDGDRSTWSDLCSTWQLDPEAISGACELILP